MTTTAICPGFTRSPLFPVRPSGLVRRLVWSILRRLQNGRLQSYALLGLLTVLVVVTWMVV